LFGDKTIAAKETIQHLGALFQILFMDLVEKNTFNMFDSLGYFFSALFSI
jgi:hypothetical protein